MFFRKSDGAAGRLSGRNGSPSQAELKELRVKARRRLVGALALVLAAVIIVPWVFDDSTPSDQPAPIVVPAPPETLSPANPVLADRGTVDDSALSPDEGTAPPADQGAQHIEPSPLTDGATQNAEPPAPPADTAKPAADAEKPAADQAKPAKPAPADEAPATKPKTPAPAQARTDDGSVALALLAGKSPGNTGASQANSGDRGSYYLQVAAYTTEQDALQRRDKLRQAGVTDAYVEKGQSAGRTVYRLRVGPFGSHDAAQAAQTRLRALGYQNGLIAQ